MDKPKPRFRYSLASMLMAIALMAALCALLLPFWRGAAPKFPPCVAGAQAPLNVRCNTCHASPATIQSGLAYLNEQPSRRRQIPEPSNPGGHPGPMQLLAGQANQCARCHSVPAATASIKQEPRFPQSPATPAHQKARSAPDEIP